jgi:hypothetical protein
MTCGENFNNRYILPIVSSRKNMKETCRLETIFKDAFSVFEIIVLCDEDDIDIFQSSLQFIPKMAELNRESYSTLGVQQLWKEGRGNPRIPWRNPEFETDVFGSKFLTVHLRRMSNDRMRRGDADFTIWDKALSRIFETKSLNIVLVGDDSRPSEFRNKEGFFDCSILGLSLVDQLRLIGQSRLFLGMASGIASAAIYSDRDYLIFKHPRQHKRSMRLEIGKNGRFNFAQQNQVFLRAIPSMDEIMRYVERITEN